MHNCFNTLHILCVLCVHFINGLNQQAETDNKTNIISNEKGKLNEEHKWLTNNENLSDTLSANIQIHQREVSKRSKDEGKVKQPKQDDSYFLTKFINKFVKNDSPSCSREFFQEPNIKKIMNRHNQILNDLIRDSVNMSEKKTVNGNYKDNTNQNNPKHATENLLKGIHLKKNKNAIFETPIYDSDEDKNKKNSVKERIKNRQPIYKGKGQLKCLTDLERRIINPLQENDVIKNVLNTQNFIAYLRKTLSNTYPGGKNSENVRNNINNETPKFIYKRFASIISGSERNHKKKKLQKPGGDASNVRKESTTKKIMDDYDYNSIESIPIVNKLSKKPKSGDGTCETTSACTVTCKLETTTCEASTTTCEPPTTTCEPSTTTCEPSTTTCEPSTTTCEPSTTCQVSETTCEETTTECKTTTVCEESTTECSQPPKKVSKKRKTFCTTKATTCTASTETEEEGECEEGDTAWPTTSNCESTLVCDESDIINSDGSDK